MISVVIPTLDAERHLGRTLHSLFPAAVEGVVSEVIVVDGGSRDATLNVAEHWGARVVSSARGRGPQLATGAAEARKSWLLFLHADTHLEPGWEEDAERFMAQTQDRAAAIRFRLADKGIGARLIERGVALRCALFGLPYGDQGLLISRALYDASGGFRPLPIMEDVDLVRRLGRKRLSILGSHAITDAGRYRKDGYLRRVLRNFGCLAMFYGGVSPSRIAKFYG
jgi:rSAM/selenodomain-associated transferase 2